ncbi:hypothetical protein AC249_AIPGENE23392 [Exaiptasia diaphana]|nr:hypothetical protein AC249_AIPGENE23392 [Exaiptasia diaphana]
MSSFKFPKQPEAGEYEIPNFEVNLFNIEKSRKKHLSLASTRRRRLDKKQQQTSENTAMAEENNSGNNDIVTFTEQELEEFKNSMVAKNIMSSSTEPYLFQA